MAVLAWSGFAIELLVLWCITRCARPAVIATPAAESPRSGPILSAGMEYHLVHHLFPSIPLNKTGAAYRELKPLLEREGMTLNGL